MTAKDRVALFLMTHRPRNFCDECAGRALEIDASTAYRAAVKLRRSRGFAREYDVCSQCGESRLVTRCISLT